jgi:hypothetical protein
MKDFMNESFDLERAAVTSREHAGSRMNNY